MRRHAFSLPIVLATMGLDLRYAGPVMLLGGVLLLIFAVWALRREHATMPARGLEAGSGTSEVDRDLATAERALALGRQRHGTPATRRLVRVNAGLTGPMKDSTAGKHGHATARVVERTVAEVAGLITYMRTRIALVEPGLAAGLTKTLDEAERGLLAVKADLGQGDMMQALARVHSLRVAVVASRRVLARRVEVAAWLDHVPATVLRLALEATRLRRAGFRGLPAVLADELTARAAIARARLARGESDALTLASGLKTEIEGLRDQISGHEALYLENERELQRLRQSLAELDGAFEGLVERRSLAFDRQQARLRTLGLELTTAAADNHKDSQRFKAARRRLTAIARELDELRTRLPVPRTREPFDAGRTPRGAWRGAKNGRHD